MIKEFNLGDKFYKVYEKPFSHTTVHVDTVTRITETENGFRYNDDIRPSSMFTDKEAVKKKAAELIRDRYDTALRLLEELELEEI